MVATPDYIMELNMSSTAPGNAVEGGFYGTPYTGNQTFGPTKSPDMLFNQGHVITITVYSVFIIVSAIGNFCVLYNILR